MSIRINGSTTNLVSNASTGVPATALMVDLEDAILQVNVVLPSGCSEKLSVPQSSKVGDLRILAQKTFGQGFLRLITSTGYVLTDPTESLESVGLQQKDMLSAIVQQANITATQGAFAVWCCGGDRIVTWGLAGFGGDSSTVRNQLKNVQRLQATDSAFAALLGDGSVVTWGRADWGGDSSAVQKKLRSVQQVYATNYAFAALLTDGSAAEIC